MDKSEKAQRTEEEKEKERVIIKSVSQGTSVGPVTIRELFQLTFIPTRCSLSPRAIAGYKIFPPQEFLAQWVASDIFVACFKCICALWNSLCYTSHASCD